LRLTRIERREDEPAACSGAVAQLDRLTARMKRRDNEALRCGGDDGVGSWQLSSGIPDNGERLPPASRSA
jgi:hypothetical protein